MPNVLILIILPSPTSLTESPAKAISLTATKEKLKIYNFEIENIGKTMINGKSHLETLPSESFIKISETPLH